MTSEEALEIIERLPFIPTVTATKHSVRFELYQEYIDSGNAIDLIRIIKSCYSRMFEKGIRKAVPLEEENFYFKAQHLFDEQISLALGVPETDIEKYIQNYLDKDM